MKISSSLIRTITIGIQGSIQAYLLPKGKTRAGSQNIVACIFSTGERSEEQSYLSVLRQVQPVTHIELIKNISPISAASNRALDLAGDADLLLWVDADMILHDTCTDYLLRLMRNDSLYAVAPLIDPVFGKIGYIKLLNMHIVKRLNLRFRDVLGCDVDFCRQAKEKDPSIKTEIFDVFRNPLGIHHPTYTAKELFRKNQVARKKRGNRIDEKMLGMLVLKYRKTRSPVLLAGILGEILSNPDASPGESTPESGLELWRRVNEMLGDIPEDLTFGFKEKERI